MRLREQLTKVFSSTLDRNEINKITQAHRVMNLPSAAVQKKLDGGGRRRSAGL